MIKKKFLYKELVKQIFRNVSWFGIVYQVSLLVFIVGPIFSKLAYAKKYPEVGLVTPDPLLSQAYYVQIFLFALMAIIIGMFLYNFLMKRSTSDFTHGLPISRISIYFHHVVSGIVILVVPIIVTALLSWLLVQTPGFTEGAGAELKCMEWILFTAGIALISFSLSTLAAMVSGNFKVQGIISVGILAMPYVFIEGLDRVLSRFLYGFSLSIKSIVNELGGNAQSVVFIVIALIALWLTFYVYKKRKVESISEPIVFNWFKPIFKYGFTTLGLFGFAIMLVMFVDTNSMFAIILFVGSLLGYVFAARILNESSVSWKNYRGFTVYAVIFFAALTGLHFYAPTYDNNVPEVNEVSEVTFETYFIQEYAPSALGKQLTSEVLDLRTLTEPESVETVTEIHKQVISQKPSSFNTESYSGIFTIIYSLEDGGEISRTYYCYESGTYDEFYAELTSLPEFRENLCVFLDTVGREEFEDITIGPSPGGNGPDPGVTVHSSDSEMYNSLIDALIEDVKIVTEFEQTVVDPNKTITISAGTTYITRNITSEYTNTIKWLEDNGFEEQANLIKE